MKIRLGPAIVGAAIGLAVVLSMHWLETAGRRGPRTDVDRRAARYVRDLGSKPLAELDVEDKLLLFHSYAILDRRRDALAVWDALAGDLDRLDPERRQVFESMAETLRREQREGLPDG